MKSTLNDQLEELHNSLDTLDTTVHDSGETSVTLSVTLDAAGFTPFIEALDDTSLTITALTYRGVNGRSTVTLEPAPTTRATAIETLEERATEATSRGSVGDDVYAFTVFGSNNRVEAHDFLAAAGECGYDIVSINATSSPPLCLDIHVTPRQTE